MKTQRRWLKSVIAAAACEEVSMPWAAVRAAKQGKVIVVKPALKLQPIAVTAPRSYAIAAR